MADRRPAAVPDLLVDTDGDGRADTGILDDGVDLVLCTDLDGDGFADRELRIGPDGVVREAAFRFDPDAYLDPAPEIPLTVDHGG
jgi:hypothetical protein